MRIGIDLGGTKIAGVVLNKAGGIVAWRRVATPGDRYAAIVSSIRDLVDELESEAGCACTVGVGMPGILSPATGLVKNSNTTVLNGKPLDRDLSAALEREVRFENDANCFALSEALGGAGADKAIVFGVILGTGTGAGIVIDGRIIRGANAIAGEWGHNPLPWPRDSEMAGLECYCGQRGCLETYLSGAGLARAYREAGGARVGADRVGELANAGDPVALSALSLYIDRLARGLAHVMNIIDPDVIVLGGGLSNLDSLYAHFPGAFEAYVFSDYVTTPVVAARHGDASGVRGAAWLWPAT